jgi:prepilin-type N-terminal cleavage/methylation domain-containing protein
MTKQKQAFTLVELIVVITILAILWTIAFISLQWYSKDARDSIRISDTSNMKTSLELFHLDSGKYPLPDANEIVDYGTETLWYQWDFWSSVISSLSRSMSEVPTDPLTDKKYIFSVANNKNEFEILSLLEWDSLVLNNINQANAATLEVTPKIDWTYNRVFIKTASFIVPVPSIINTEVWTATMTLDSSNISSQVVNSWENIPEQWNVISNTWALIWLALSVYTWSIAIDDSNTVKEAVIQKIKDTYTGSVLANSDIYNYILSTNWTEWLVKLANSIILNDDTTEVIITYNPYENCIWINSPAIWDINIISSSIYWVWTWNECNEVDIIVCSWPWTWYTISACNVWTSIASTNYDNWYWELFQWWNNEWIRSAAMNTTPVSVTSTWSTYNGNGYFINSSEEWELSQNDNLWWNTPWSDLDRKWPCEEWYHVPTQDEWNWLHTAWWWGSAWTTMRSVLRLPASWNRYWVAGNYYWLWNYWQYWSSTPDGTYSSYFVISSTNVTTLSAPRAYWFAVRCFKN